MWTKEEKITLGKLFISLVGLVLSFFKIQIFNVDLAWVSIILCGLPIIKGAVEALIKDFDIKADVLVSIALVATVVIGEVFASGEVAFIMTLGALLEEHTVGKARSNIEKLIDLAPKTARIIRGNQEEIVDPKEVVIGDVVKILPGETIVVDGIITKGASSIDQSLMTGEYIPVDKILGDEVYSGTINQLAPLEIRATKVGDDSSLQKMIELVKSVNADKAQIVKTTDKWATWIVVMALTASLITGIITKDVIRSVTILVVFCPCALVLATPTSIIASIGNLTKYGILVKTGETIERLGQVTKIAFDKTGTLTHGHLQVEEVFTSDSVDNATLLKYINSLESKSEHPIGRAIYRYSTEKAIGYFEVENFKMEVGMGLSGEVNNKEIIVGNEEFFRKMGINLQILAKEMEYLEKGSLVIFCGIDKHYMGSIVLSDEIRDTAHSTIENLRKIHVESLLITGDNQNTAKNVSEQLGIEKYFPNSLPEQKLAILKDCEKNGEKVAMIGDGINDAPSLKASFVGVAMGQIGSDIAIDAADVVLLNDKIDSLPHLIKLCRKTLQTIKLNIVLSLFLNFVAIILAISGHLSPILGALVHNVGSIIVIMHSATLLKWKES